MVLPFILPEWCKAPDYWSGALHRSKPPCLCVFQPGTAESGVAPEFTPVWTLHLQHPQQLIHPFYHFGQECQPLIYGQNCKFLAEGEGFEPPLGLLPSLISSQVLVFRNSLTTNHLLL